MTGGTGAEDVGASGASGRVVVVPGATGVTGRAVASALTASGATVIALGTDAARLASVDAAEREVVDLLDEEAAATLAAAVLERHGRVDGLVHLVGGWKPGWSDEVTDWLNARLVTTLLNTTTAFEPALLAAPAARLVLVSSTAVTREGPPASAYAAAKLAAESWVEQLAGRWADTDAAAVTWIVRSLGDGERDTAPTSVADAAVRLWDAPASELNGARIRL